MEGRFGVLDGHATAREVEQHAVEVWKSMPS